MWADGVVLAPLDFDQNLGLLECVEDFAVQEFIMKADEVDGSRSRHLSGRMGCCQANPSQSRANGIGKGVREGDDPYGHMIEPIRIRKTRGLLGTV